MLVWIRFREVPESDSYEYITGHEVAAGDR